MPWLPQATMRMDNLKEKVVARWTRMSAWRAFDTWMSHLALLRR